MNFELLFADQSQPVRYALTGAKGGFSRTLLAQTLKMPRLTAAALCDLDARFAWNWASPPTALWSAAMLRLLPLRPPTRSCWSPMSPSCLMPNTTSLSRLPVIRPLVTAQRGARSKQDAT